jgi:predicted Zn finger-like uncharacterized protein
MKITCQSCGAKYAIADEKVRGRRVKVRCKGCSEPIIVDGYSEQPEEAAAGADYGAAAGADHGAAAGADAWNVNLSDTDQRSMTTNEIVDAWNAGQIPADAFVWKEGMGDWVPLASAPELAAYLSAPQHSAPVQPEPDPGGAFAFPGASAGGAAARVESNRGAVDIFGAQALAGSETDLSSSPAQPGEGAYDDQKPTGARNENSVLFSLDALKAGIGPADAKPAPGPRKPGTMPPPKDEKADLDDIMGIGGGSMGGPLFGMGANQALLAAPPPPPEPPPRPSIPSEMPAAFGSMPPPGFAPQKKSNTLVLAVGGGVGLLAIIAIVIGVFALRSGNTEEAKAETGGKKAEQGSGKSGSGGDDKKDEKKSEDEKKTDETKPADTAAAAASGAPEEKKEVTEEEKKRFAEAMKKKEEEAKDTKPEEKKEEVAKKEEPSAGVASFNKGAAIAALGAAAAQASGCKRPGGPTGSGRAVVTFATSGRVTTANVSGGSFPGTPVGSCVAGVFRRAQVPAFGGAPVTVSKSFSISP